ncbi:YunG family protein [Geobacillus thermodenitrificans]|uniref:YunG family protein n=2 Tax=Geobacillus TaxID=129337 RepID=UPI003D23932A
MHNLEEKILELKHVLMKVWSIESSSKWTPQNPAKGQCGVTALVVNDIFGGEILKTLTPEGWHFYNKINGQLYDLTESQFSEAIEYMDIPSNREEAFSDTNERQYNYLKQNVYKNFFKGN